MFIPFKIHSILLILYKTSLIANLSLEPPPFPCAHFLIRYHIPSHIDNKTLQLDKRKCMQKYTVR